MASHIYLSPHLDDAVFSCGGLIAHQVAQDEDVLVLTVCAGEPPDLPLSSLAQRLHSRWGFSNGAVVARRTEDRMACGQLGAQVHQLPIPEAIYRRDEGGDPYYYTEAGLFGSLDPAEESLVQTVAAMVEDFADEDHRMYCPIALGGHVDHRLVRKAAESLDRSLIYYQDFPYALRGAVVPEGYNVPQGTKRRYPLAPEEIRQWAEAVAVYRSQLSSFWEDYDQLLRELQGFHDKEGGLVMVFSPPPAPPNSA